MYFSVTLCFLLLEQIKPRILHCLFDHYTRLQHQTANSVFPQLRKAGILALNLPPELHLLCVCTHAYTKLMMPLTVTERKDDRICHYQDCVQIDARAQFMLHLWSYEISQTETIFEMQLFPLFTLRATTLRIVKRAEELTDLTETVRGSR